jgi:ketosteroid isomerase-like protein
MRGERTMMRKVAEAFAQADLRPLFDAIGENIVWKSASNVEGASTFGGTYQNRLGVLEVTSQVAAAYVFRRFTPKEIVSSADIIWGLFNVQGDYLPSGQSGVRRPFEFECAIRWRMQGNKIVEHQAFFDTNYLLHQQRVRPPHN